MVKMVTETSSKYFSYEKKGRGALNHRKQAGDWCQGMNRSKICATGQNLSFKLNPFKHSIYILINFQLIYFSYYIFFLMHFNINVIIICNNIRIK